MKRWLGIPLFNSEHICSACGTQQMDLFGHHATTCANSGDRIKKHNALRDCIFNSCSLAAWSPIKEKAFLFAGTSERPADIFIPNFSCGKGLVTDVAVTCPLQHKYVFEAAKIMGFASSNYADEVKNKNFQKRAEEEGYLYQPLVVESFGGWTPESLDFFHKLCTSISYRRNEPKNLCYKFLLERLSCILMKHNARAVSSRFPEFFSFN